jgi:gliding motility-associated-like protein
VVHPKPVINLAPEYILCEGSTVSINAQAGFSSYLWSNGSTSPNVVINQAGNYTLQTTLSYGSVICESTQNFVVTDSNIANISSIDLSDWTDNNNTITINVTGTGQYEYSLDGNIYQESNQFSGLLPGLYNLYVNDMNGCGLITEEVFLLMYPHFFTPNGDGFNDLWHIKLVSYEPGLTVEIYDRYGKFITNYTGMKEGWDGTLNGEELPSSDYWFVVKRVSGKEYRGHFSLKR